MFDVGGVKKNIFPGAHDAIWGAFPWHDGAASPHSSQALACWSGCEEQGGTP